MRPSRLDPLFASLTSLPGIGPKLQKLFARLFGRETPRIVDLLFHLPTGGLGLNVVRKAAEAALARVPVLPEWQDTAWLKQQSWPAFGQALAALHHPGDPSSVAPETPAWSRLAYDESLAGQLALALV